MRTAIIEKEIHFVISGLTTYMLKELDKVVLIDAIVREHPVEEAVACTDRTHQCLTGLLPSTVLDVHTLMLIAPSSLLIASSRKHGLVN
jgi:hypothetical protein